MQLYDGREYWGEWQCGLLHGWGVERTKDGGNEYRGEFRGGKYCGLGVLSSAAATKCGRWIDGVLVVRQHLAASALFAARDAAIRAGSSLCLCKTVFL